MCPAGSRPKFPRRSTQSTTTHVASFCFLSVLVWCSTSMVRVVHTPLQVSDIDVASLQAPCTDIDASLSHSKKPPGQCPTSLMKR